MLEYPYPTTVLAYLASFFLPVLYSTICPSPFIISLHYTHLAKPKKLPLFCVFRVPSTHLYHHSHPAMLQGWIFLFSPTSYESWPCMLVTFSPPSVYSHAQMLNNYFLKEGGASLSSQILLVINVNLEKFLNFCSNHFPCL